MDVELLCAVGQRWVEGIDGEDAAAAIEVGDVPASR